MTVKLSRLLLSTFFILAAIAGVFLVPPAPVSAATPIYVSTTGSDTYNGESPTWVSGLIGPKLTIQAGVNIVDVNGTVYVAAGNYPEQVTIGKSLTRHFSCYGSHRSTVCMADLYSGNKRCRQRTAGKSWYQCQQLKSRRR
jgi:hypothetical protein